MGIPNIKSSKPAVDSAKLSSVEMSLVNQSLPTQSIWYLLTEEVVNIGNIWAKLSQSELKLFGG